ncbi:MAG: hypothetical protein JRJ87_07335 [Deltaproteobacteria bacterium]|nr:hypothetical protein [Deltaproteobacteria bacterium]
MRYLYGDLSEFPAQENTLDLLQRFVDMAVEVLKLDLQIDKALDSIEQDRQYLVDSIDDIGSFHDTLHETIKTAASGLDPDDVVAVIAQGASDQFSRYLSDAKNKLANQVEQRVQRIESEIANLSRTIHEFLKVFFVPSVLPIGGNSLRCALDGQHYRAFSEILDVTGTRCSYTINTADSEFFSEPKKFGDLSPGKIDFPVGTKKAWLKKAPVTESMRIDDAALSQVLDHEEYGEFRLLKRAGNGLEGLLVRIKKGRNGEVSIFRLDPAGQEIAVPKEIINPSHSELMSEFWRQLYPSVVALYRTRGDLSFISINGKEVVQGRLVVELVRRLVNYLSPTIREIDARSPAIEELCLKVEHEGGRREEIYIQKNSLAKRISDLPGTLQSLFSSLDIIPGIETLSEDVEENVKVKEIETEEEVVEIEDEEKEEEDTFDGPPTEPEA